MDSLGNKLRQFKYYRLNTNQVAQYIRVNRSHNYVFKWKNPIGVERVIQQIPFTIKNNPPIPVNTPITSNGVRKDAGTDTKSVDGRSTGGRKTRKTRKQTRTRQK